MYGNEALVINQWEGIQNITCNPDDPAGCKRSGDDVLSELSFKKVKISSN